MRGSIMLTDRTLEILREIAAELRRLITPRIEDDAANAARVVVSNAIESVLARHEGKEGEANNANAVSSGTHNAQPPSEPEHSTGG